MEKTITYTLSGDEFDKDYEFDAYYEIDDVVDFLVREFDLEGKPGAREMAKELIYYYEIDEIVTQNNEDFDEFLRKKCKGEFLEALRDGAYGRAL